jgi:predicted phosphate transport protein (TIGR00153 family)
MSVIGNLFGHSPIRPMQRHMEAAVQCAREILPLVDAMASGDLAEIAACRARIDKLEHVADEIKNEIRGKLPQRLFMAMERRDLLEILNRQDSIADVAQDVAEIADLRGMHTPAPLVKPLKALAKRSVATCGQAEQAISRLDELVETGFGKREIAHVEKMLAELSRLESETDDLSDECLGALFSVEDELGVATFFWYELIGWVGKMSDHAEAVGNRVRLLIAD